MKRWGEAVIAGLLVGLLCAAYLSLAWYGFDLLEEGYFATHARRVQLGGLPYRDFSTPYTPGVFYLYAWLMDGLGPNVVALRFLQVVGRGVLALALYAAGRRLMPPFFAALAPAVMLAVDTAPALWSLHPGWYSAPAAVLAVLAVARYLEGGRGRWLFAAGIATGVAFAFKQNLAAYALMASLWLLVVAERHLPPLVSTSTVEGPRPLALVRELEHQRRRAGAPAGTDDRPRRVAQLVRAARVGLQLATLALLPLTAAVLVRPYLSPLVAALFVAPLAAVSVAGALVAFPTSGPRAEGLRGPRDWSPGCAQRGRPRRLLPVGRVARRAGREPNPPRIGPRCGDVFAREASFYLRPLLVLAGFGVVTLPWLWSLISALDGRVELLAGFVGNIDPTGYFYSMKPPQREQLQLVGALLVVPMVAGALGALGFWGRPALACGLGALLWLVAAGKAAPSSGAEPWNVAGAAQRAWQAAGAAWNTYGAHPHRTDDLILYLPVLAFWVALVRQFKIQDLRLEVKAAESGGGERDEFGTRNAERGTHPESLLRLWYLAAGAALLLNQYPRMDEAHLPWSGGLLLVVGADVLHAWQRGLVRLAPLIDRSAGGRAALRLSLVLLPAVAVLPLVWQRLDGLSAVTAAAPGAPAALGSASPRLLPLDLPTREAGVWLPADDVQPLQEVVQLLHEKTAPGEPIFTYPGIPGFYFLADRPNATRFNHLFAGMASPADQQAMVAQLETVRYVVWDDGGAHFWVRPGDNAPVTEYIRAHFRVERFIGRYAVLARDAFGPELLYFLPD